MCEHWQRWRATSSAKTNAHNWNDSFSTCALSIRILCSLFARRCSFRYARMCIASEKSWMLDGANKSVGGGLLPFCHLLHRASISHQNIHSPRDDMKTEFTTFRQERERVLGGNVKANICVYGEKFHPEKKFHSIFCSSCFIFYETDKT